MCFSRISPGRIARVFNQLLRRIFMEEPNILEQLTNSLPNETAVPLTAKPDELTLIEVMEICSDLCVTHPFCLLQMLEEVLLLPEITLESAFAEIMSLKVSPFGKRLTQIH